MNIYRPLTQALKSHFQIKKLLIHYNIYRARGDTAGYHPNHIVKTFGLWYIKIEYKQCYAEAHYEQVQAGPLVK